MNEKSNPRLTKNAQTLRKNMTQAERRLWYDFLKDMPYTINRQKTIGAYIVDFYCAKAKLVIELDGGQHDSPEAKHADQQRDACLRQMGIAVLRYSNLDVQNNFSGVCADILMHLPAESGASSGG